MSRGRYYKSGLSQEIRASMEAIRRREAARTNLLGEGGEGAGPFGPGYEALEAPTSFAAWPRARVIGYNYDTKTLVVIFRDKEWVMYTSEVQPDLWESLKNATSTGTFLKDYGIDDLPYTYVTNRPDLLPRKAEDQMRYGISEVRPDTGV